MITGAGTIYVLIVFIYYTFYVDTCKYTEEDGEYNIFNMLCFDTKYNEI